MASGVPQGWQRYMAVTQVQGARVVRWEAGAARQEVQRRRRRLGRAEGEGGLWVQFCA